MTKDAFTLALIERDRRAPFAIGEAARSWGDLLDDAGRIAARLKELLDPAGAEARGEVGGDSPEIMLACADRYVGAAALLAIWDIGAVAALPPNGREETVDALCAERRIALLLHDGGGGGGIDVRPWLMDESGPRTDVAPPDVAPPGFAPPGFAPPGFAPPSFAPSRRLVCLYTSGSTGAHLACPKTARQLLGEARLLSQLFDLGPGARILATVPPTHIYGLLFGVLVPFMGGGALIRGTPHHAETIAAEARRWQANVLCSVPAHLQGLTALTPAALPPLRRIFSSGAPLPGDAARAVAAAAGVPVVEVLGSSETGGVAWRQGGDDPLWQPFPGIDVSADEDGVMIVRSPFADTNAISVGGDDPAGAATAPVRGADRIRTAPGGRFELLGRADGVVKIGGSRIATGEVEHRLLEIPGVREAAVIAVDVPGLRQRALWAVVVAPGLAVADLRAALLRRVDPIAVPRRFRLVEALPREDNGKLVKARLRALFSPRREDPPATPTAPTSVATTAATPAAPAARERPSLKQDRQEDLPEDLPDPKVCQLKVCLDADSPFFRGHFEGFPILPGVVQVNNLVLENARARWPELGRLQRVNALKFRSPIRPHDEVAVILERREPNRVVFEIRRAERLMSSGSLVFASDPQGAPAPASDRLPGGAAAPGGVPR